MFEFTKCIALKVINRDTSAGWYITCQFVPISSVYNIDAPLPIAITRLVPGICVISFRELSIGLGEILIQGSFWANK